MAGVTVNIGTYAPSGFTASVMALGDGRRFISVRANDGDFTFILHGTDSEALTEARQLVAAVEQAATELAVALTLPASVEG